MRSMRAQSGMRTSARRHSLTARLLFVSRCCCPRVAPAVACCLTVPAALRRSALRTPLRAGWLGGCDARAEAECTQERADQAEEAAEAHTQAETETERGRSSDSAVLCLTAASVSVCCRCCCAERRLVSSLP